MLPRSFALQRGMGPAGLIAAGLFAVGLGTAGIIACSDVRPAVLSAPPSSGMAAGSSGLALSRGEAVAIDHEDGRAVVPLVASGEGERYVIVLTSTTPGARAPIRYRATVAAPGETGGSSRWRLLDGCSVSAETVAERPEPAAPRAPAPPLEPGTRRRFQVPIDGESVEIEAAALRVGAESAVWTDHESDPPAELDAAFASEFLEDFEATILPRVRDVFGVESDIDGDGRIALLFTSRTAGRSVAFFRPCDLSPAPDCADRANRAEVLYLTPPNAIRPPYNTPRAIKEILAHELEHLVHHHHKVLAHSSASDSDSAYLLEGFGALAQDVTGFAAGNLYVTKAGFEGIDRWSWSDLLRTNARYDPDRDGALRGGAYLFVRWLYDRAGGDEVDGRRIVDRGGPTLVRALLSSESPIPVALAERSGSSLESVVADFATAMAFTDPASTSYPVAQNPCFSYRPPQKDPITGRTRGVDPRLEFHGQRLAGASIVELAEQDGLLTPGGIELLSLEPSPSAAPMVLTLEASPADDLSVRLVRTR